MGSVRHALRLQHPGKQSIFQTPPCVSFLTLFEDIHFDCTLLFLAAACGVGVLGEWFDLYERSHKTPRQTSEVFPVLASKSVKKDTQGGV